MDSTRRALKSINRDIDRALAKARKQPMTSPFLTERPLAWYEIGWVQVTLAVLVGVCTVVVVMLAVERLLR